MSGRQILITGATGQVAGALARGLARDNEVIALARFSEAGSRDALEAAGVRTVYGDFVTGDLGEAPDHVDYVIHSAANTRPRDSEEAMRINAEGPGMVMSRFRTAKGFLHISATGVYVQNPDPNHIYDESDEIGGGTAFCPLYGASKTAGEGVVRSLSRVFNLPVTIARLNVAYGGPYADGGLPGRQLDAVLSGDPIKLPKSWSCILAPIHEDDLTDHVLPLLDAASVPATIVNWGGDDGVAVEDWVRYLGELVGKEPNIVFDDDAPWPNWIGDHAKRRALGCHCKVDWRSGMRRLVQARHPEVKILA
jgi:nucleoside-diphosphate-sugar epimerase